MFSNKKMGSSFERKFCNALADCGFWVHNVAQNAYGQPADVIASRDGKAYLIDCKVCSSRGFALSRIEDNQEMAMQRWNACGNGDGWFALLIDSEIYMLSLSDLLMIRDSGRRVLSLVDATTIGKKLWEWIEECK